MIKIAASELKEFKARASGLRQNNILPILSYIKLEVNGNEGTITASNQKTFIVHEIKCKCKQAITVLLEQKTLFSLLDQNDGDTITIDVDSKSKTIDNKPVERVTLSDGLNKVPFTTMPAQHFPATPKIDGEKSIFNKPVLEALSAAKDCTEKKIENWAQFVFIENRKDQGSWIFGTTGQILYLKKFEEELPDVALFPEDISFIEDFDEVIYSSADNYNFFQTGKTSYAFIKSVEKPKDVGMITRSFVDTTGFTIDRSLVLKYCSLVEGVKGANSVLVGVSIKDAGKNKVQMHYTDYDFGKGADREFEVDKEGTIATYNFKTSDLTQAIKKLPFKSLTINITEHGNMCFLTTVEDPEYIGACNGILLQEQEPVHKTAAATA